MIAPFGFAAPGQIIFGRGECVKAPTLAAKMGVHAFVVHGARLRHAESLLLDLNMKATPFCCPKEPDLPLLELALKAARAASADCVIAIGGGAAMDLGKAVAGLLPSERDPMDHLEVVGRGLPLCRSPFPFMAIPTTSGTGAEMTKNAVIGLPEHKRKVSLRDAGMIADVALIDPALTDATPRGVTLASGLDAITQVIEPFLCNRATPLTDALCRDAIPRGLSALRRLMRDEDKGARDDLAMTSMAGGLALANSGLGVVHGLAGVIGGHVPGAAHGAICGALLGPSLCANAKALPPDGEIAARVAWILAEMDSHLGISDIAVWAREMGLPGLSDLGLDPDYFAQIATEAYTSSSMKANPVPLPHSTLMDILSHSI